MNANELWARLDPVGFAWAKLLLAVLWQSSILLAAIGALAWLLRKKHATVRRALWMAGLLAAPLLPFVAAAVLEAGAPQAPVRVLPAYVAQGGTVISVGSVGSDGSDGSVGVNGERAPAALAGAREAMAPTVQANTPAKPFSALDYPWSLALAGYAAVLAGFLAWIALGRLRIRGWIRSSEPVTEERTLAVFGSARAAIGLERSFLLLRSRQVPAPMSYGLLHPVVLLPERLAERLGDEELRALAVHELAHVKRHDSAALLAAALVRAALFFHPLVWLGARRVSALSEQAADDAVLEASFEPVPYAKLLARLAEELPRRAISTELAAGILFTRGAFLRRIEAILSDQRDRFQRLTRIAMLGTALGLLLSFGIALAAPLGEKAGTSEAEEARRVRIVTDGTTLTFEGEKTTWEELPSLLAKVTDRPNTIVEFAISSDSLTLAQANEALGKVRFAVYPLEFKYLSNIGVHPMGSKGGSDEEPAARMAPDGSAATNATDSGNEVVTLGYVDDTAEEFESIATSGHGVVFKRPENARFVEAVQVFGSRYGTPQPPDEDFHIYLLNDKYQVLADVPFPYSTFERGDMKWYTLETPAVEVPESFVLALDFNPHMTKGIYVGIDKGVAESHSLLGLPDDGYETWARGGDWMVRIRMTEQPSAGKEAKRLADWKPPVAEQPFTGSVEMKYDSGKPEGKQSYGGSGPAIRFLLGDFFPSAGAPMMPDGLKLKGFRFYASRYGSGYNAATTMLKVLILDSSGKVLREEQFPYGRMSYQPRWIDLALKEPLDLAPLTSEGAITVAFDPAATQTKGVYFHYNKDPAASHSMVWNAQRGLTPAPDREWMIRAVIGAAAGER